MTDGAFWFFGNGATKPTEPFAGQLVVDGPYFTAGGALVYPLGLTSFLALKRRLTGQSADADAWFAFTADLAREAGDGVVPLARVFSDVAEWTGPPGKGVEPGFAAIDFPNYDDESHRLYDAAQRAGVYVQMVALTHNFGGNLDAMLEHCARVDRIAAQHECATFQAANEPSVNNIPIDAIVARFAPICRPADTGRLDPSPWPGWDYVGDHPARTNESCRYFKGGWEVQEGSGPNFPFQPPWPRGFYQDEPGRIEDVSCWPTPDDLASFYAGNRFFCSGGVIHGGQWAQGCHLDMVTPDLTVRLGAICAAVGTVPSQRYFGYAHPNDQGSLRRYRRHNAAGQWYEISVRPFGFWPV